MGKSISSIIGSLLVGVVLAGPVLAQNTTIRGAAKGSSLPLSVTATNADANHTALDVNITGGSVTVQGSAGGTSQTDNTAITSITGVGALYDTTPPAITDGNVGLFRMNASRQLFVECAAGCSGGVQFAEDAAHTSGESGTLLLGVRRDADTSLVDTTGDYTPLQFDALGNLKVNVKAGTAVGLVDDAAFTPGASVVTPMGATFDDVTPDTVNEGDIGAPRMSANRNLYHTIRDAAGNERGLNISAGGNLSVDTVTTVTTVSAVTAITNALPAGANNIGDVDVVSQIPGVGATNLGKAEDAVHTSGDTGVMMLGVRDDTLDVRSGAENDYEPFHMTAAGRLYTSATIDAALPAGNNNIGDVDIASAVTVIQGTGSNLHVACDSGCTSVQYAEDAAHASGNSVTMAGVVQQAADAALSGDGDNSLLQVDANGYLKVNIKAGAGSGGTAMTDDAAFTPASTSITPAGAMFDDVAPDSVNEGDGGVVRMSANRNLYNTIRDAAGNERGLNVAATGNLSIDTVTTVTTVTTVGAVTAISNALPAGNNNIGDVDIASIIPGVGATNLGKAEDAVHASGDTGNFIMGVRHDTATTGLGVDGDYAALGISAGGRLYTEATISGSVTVTDGAGALNVIVDSGTLTAVTSITNPVTVTDGAGALNVICDSGCGSGTQYAEDAAETAGAQLSMAGTVRRDTAASSATTSGDNATLNTDSIGRAWTRPTGSVTPADNFAIPTDAITVWSINGCYDGATIDLCQKATVGNGTVDATTQRVTIASDSTGKLIIADSGGTAFSAGSNGTNTSGAGTLQVAMIAQLDDTSPTTITENNFGNLRITTTRDLMVRPDTSGATGAAPPARASFTGVLGSGATGGFVQGFPAADTFANINVSTATTTLLVTGVSGRHVRITSLNLVTAAANNVALISGTGATCGTGTTGMTGGTTAASGWNFGANGGISQAGGLGAINQTNATGDSVCIVTSAATQLSGRLGYAIY